MKLSSVLVHGALAVAALGAAYATWQREPAAAPGSVVVVDFAKKDLETVRFEDSSRWAELVRTTEEGEPVVWVRSGTKPPAAVAAADAGTADAGVAVVPPHPVTPDRELRGNEAALKLFDRLAPLQASRALGALDTAKLKELGLATPSRRLLLSLRGGRTEPLEVSDSGPGTPYVRTPTDGKVYLLGGSLISDLEAAGSRLVDRRLHAFTMEEVDSVTLAAGGKSRAFVLVPGVNPGELKLAAATSAKQPDEFANNWHNKALRVTPMELLGKGELPASGAPEVKFRLDYSSKGKPKGYLELAGKGSELFAKSEHTASWVRLGGGSESLVAEAARIAEEKK